jgi:PKD repeat protein
MQKTANQIKSEFELLASGHYQIHSFLYAQEFEQQAYENLIYPLMLVYPLGGNLSGTSYTRNYRVVIADRVLKSEGNELEVESDTQLIALDTLAYWMKLGANERFSITSSNTITPFWEKWGDEVTGHFVDIGIEEFYDFNSCAIPLSSAIPSPTNPCKDARILINSVIYGNAPSNSNFNVVVKDQLGALVGSLIGGEWIVNTGGSCADATYTIEDSLGNVLYTGTIPSGGSVTEVIGNSTLNVNKSDGTLISSRSILAEGTDSYNVGDSSAVLKDEDGNVLSTTPIKATESKDIVAPNGDVSVNSVAFDDVLSGGTLNIQVRKSTGNDLIGSKQGQYWRIGDSTAVIKDSANNTLKSEAIIATETENIVVNDSVAVIKNSAGTTLKSENILAQASENITINDSSVENSDATYSVDVLAEGSLILPDSQINVNSVDSGDVVSVKTIDVNLEDSLGAPVTPTSVGLVGNTLTIEVPSGSTPMDVDFSADKLVAYIGETITFTDLSDQSPTHWSWRFSDGTNSIVQNPTKSFNTSGFFNVILLAGKVGAGGVNIKNSYIEINELFFTEIFGVPNALFSLRKLSPDTTYSGAAIRVRRSSDNTEQDIGFVSSSANSGLDTTALLSFVGAGNGFVVTWYNQNGSGNHATQSTAANQPQIVTSGVVELSSSLPTIKLDGSNDFLLFSSVFTSTINLTTFAITQSAAVSTNQYIYDNSNDGASGGGYALRYLNSGGFRAWAQNANSNASGGSTTNNVPVLLSQLSRLTGGTTENNEIWVNNASVGTNSGGTGVRNAKTTTRFGHSELLEGFLNGKISEIIAFDTYKSTDRAAITTNINTYYNVF